MATHVFQSFELFEDTYVAWFVFSSFALFNSVLFQAVKNVFPTEKTTTITVVREKTFNKNHLNFLDIFIFLSLFLIF